MKLLSALDRDWLQSLKTLHKVISFSFHFFVTVEFRKTVFFIPIFSASSGLSEVYQSASTIIKELSANWDRVRQQLNLVSRLPAYRFHMRVVGFSLKSLEVLRKLFNLPFLYLSQIRYTNA